MPRGPKQATSTAGRDFAQLFPKTAAPQFEITFQPNQCRISRRLQLNGVHLARIRDEKAILEMRFEVIQLRRATPGPTPDICTKLILSMVHRMPLRISQRDGKRSCEILFEVPIDNEVQLDPLRNLWKTPKMIIYVRRLAQWDWRKSDSITVTHEKRCVHSLSLAVAAVALQREPGAARCLSKQ